MVYSGAWEKLIHEKNQKSKISWHCPFKPRNNQSSADLLRFRSISREVYSVHGLSVIQSEPTFYWFFSGQTFTGYKDIAYTNLETYFIRPPSFFLSTPSAPLAYPLLEIRPRGASPQPTSDPPPPHHLEWLLWVLPPPPSVFNHILFL